MPKEKNYNPMQEQRKADKAKALKKGKQEATNRKNEKFAKRNPERIQKQIDELKQITTNGGKLSKHEESVLEGLERDLKAVKKAREALGDKAPAFGRGPRQDGDGVLGKRRRGRDDGSSDDSDVPDDVKSIPMPRDTPPPIPKEILDEWYAKRRAKRNENANNTPLGRNNEHNTNNATENRVPNQQERRAAPAPVVSQTVYEAKPVVRDLRKEAVSAFVPAAVRQKMDKSKGQGGLMEPEEADQLELEGYLKTTTAPDDQGKPRGVTMEEVEDEDN